MAAPGESCVRLLCVCTLADAQYANPAAEKRKEMGNKEKHTHVKVRYMRVWMGMDYLERMVNAWWSVGYGFTSSRVVSVSIQLCRFYFMCGKS